MLASWRWLIFLSTIILLLTYYSTVDTLVQVVAVSNKSFDALANYSLGDQAHSEGENCIIVSGSTSPGPSAIKVWYHKPVSAPLYSLYIICNDAWFIGPTSGHRTSCTPWLQMEYMANLRYHYLLFDHYQLRHTALATTSESSLHLAARSPCGLE